MFFPARRTAVGFYRYLCVALLLSFSLPLHASEITLESEVGFHGLFHLGRPFPLTIEIANSGRPVEGTLELKVWKGGPTKGQAPYPLYYRKKVFLSAQSRRSVQFTVEPDSISRPLIVRFSSPEVDLSREVDLRGHFSASPLMLLLTENRVSTPIPLAVGSSSSLISLSVRDLPSEARAYHGVSTILFYEQSLRDLSKSQSTALETWLSAGGRMIFLGSMHYALYQEPSMSRFLPVRVSGLKKISFLSGLERSYGAKASSLRDVWIQDSRLVEGSVVVEEKGTPVLVETSRGRGKVFYLSLDVGRPPFSEWQGLSLLFKDLLKPPVEERFSPRSIWDNAVFSKLLVDTSLISNYMPSGAFLFGILSYLGAMGLWARLWRRQRFRRRSLVAAFLFLVLAFALGGYFYLDRGQIPEAVLLSSTLLESVPDGYVDAHSNVALFSTRRRYYNLGIENGWTDFEPLASGAGDPDDPAVIVEGGGASTRFRFPLREWDYRLFRVRSMDRFPFRAEIESQGDHFFVKLTNLATRDLADCWLFISGQRIFLGDLRRGSTQKRELPLSITDASESNHRSSREDLREGLFDDHTREILFRHSFFPDKQSWTRWSGGSVLFVGWVKNPPRRVWVDGAGIRAYDYALFRVIIPWDEERES
jgi:hypothetical protein